MQRPPKAKSNTDALRAAFALALADHQAGRFDKAEAAYRGVLRSHPDHADSLNLLGVVLCQTGRAAEGQPLIAKAARLRPSAQYFLNLALAHRTMGEPQKAIEAARRAIALEPGMFDAHLTFAQACEQSGAFDQALAAYFTSLEISPDRVDLYHQIGAVLEELGRNHEAAAAFRIVLGHRPDDVEALRRLGALLHDMGREDEAEDCYRRALALKPGDLELEWRLVCGRLRLVYASEAEIERARAEYEAGLRRVAERVAQASAENLSRLNAALGFIQPFYLPYQGHDDVELQRVYGAMVCRAVQAACPGYAERPPTPAPGPGGRLRIGFVSGYFSRHSNWKIPIKGWVQHIDRTRFKTFAYHVGKRSDDETDIARTSFDSFVEGKFAFEEWARRIRADDLHLLVFPETGMDPTTLKLAALRLAPVQAVSWGHPNTSGLPTIDYFLSSALMESADADAFYTETLVRLPNLSIHYAPPYAPRVERTREQLGLRPDAIVYWCCQSLFKYLPRYDDALAQIARRVPNAQFVFINFSRGARVNETMQERLMRAFMRRGLSAQRHCLFMPQMDLVKFNAIARASDVFLDTIGWSACNSLLEALMFDLPPVALAGQFMRGRHATAILEMMGLSELVAADPQDYVERAVRLGLDADLRGAVREKIAARKHRLLGDLECVRGLERFIEGAVSTAAGPPTVAQATQ